VPGEAAEPPDLEGVGEPAAPVGLVRHGPLAALVSEFRSEEAVGTARDLRAHAEVLDATAAARTAVLPLRFGTVARDATAVAEEILAPHEAEFLGALRGLTDCAQFTVRGDYHADRLLREVLKEQPDIAQLREQASATGDQDLQLRLGTLVAEAVTERRHADTRLLMDRLGPLAQDALSGTRESNDPEEQSIRASFLVRYADRERFTEAAEELAREWAERMRMRLLGPVAPYDFVGEIG
jgi:hypothetical protein